MVFFKRFDILKNIFAGLILLNMFFFYCKWNHSRCPFFNNILSTCKETFASYHIHVNVFFVDKTQEDKEQEGMLIDQWVSLTEERNAILCPNTGSGVPGAASDW